MNPKNPDKKGRVTLSISPGVLRAARAVLNAGDSGDLSPLVEKLLHAYLKKEGFPTALSSEALKKILKQAACDDPAPKMIVPTGQRNATGLPR